ERWKQVLLGGAMPLHWYLAAFISVWGGVALIIIYHLIASRLEDRFQEVLAASWQELPEEIQASLGHPSAAHGRTQGD
ncbi:MAG TPA: hypothetical protein VF282_09735, partial [Bacillota bacterium]